VNESGGDGVNLSVVDRIANDAVTDAARAVAARR